MAIKTYIPPVELESLKALKPPPSGWFYLDPDDKVVINGSDLKEVKEAGAKAAEQLGFAPIDATLEQASFSHGFDIIFGRFIRR